jgi:hypothetical protein
MPANKIVDFSLHDVLGAAEHIIKPGTSTSHGDVRTLEDDIALILRSIDVSALEPFARDHAEPPPNADLPGLIIIGLFLVLVLGSIMLVNWYFHATFGV